MSPRRPVRRALLALAVALVALAGCTSTARTKTGTSDGEGVVGVALPSSADLAFVRLGDALGEELRGRGFRVDLEYAADDDRTQSSQVLNMVTKGEDALVLLPLSSAVVDAARAATDSAGVRLITVGGDLDATAGVASADPAAIGRAEAEALLDALPRASATSDPATVAIVAGVADDPDTAAAHAAATEALASAIAAGSVRVVAGTEVEGAAVADTRGGIQDASEDRIRSLAGATDGGAPDAILVLGDAASRGAVTALTTPDPDTTPSPSPAASAGRTEFSRTPPVVVTSGGDAPTVGALRDGVIAATVFVDTRAWAVPIADAVEAALSGGEPSPGPRVAVRTVDRDAVQNVFLDSGWLRAEDLDG